MVMPRPGSLARKSLIVAAASGFAGKGTMLKVCPSVKMLSWSAMVPDPGSERASGGATSPDAKLIQATMIAQGAHLNRADRVRCFMAILHDATQFCHLGA